MTLRYVVIDECTFVLGDSWDEEDARASMADLGYHSALVWEAPYGKLEEAEDNCWDGARLTGTRFFADETMPEVIQ